MSLTELSNLASSSCTTAQKRMMVAINNSCNSKTNSPCEFQGKLGAEILAKNPKQVPKHHQTTTKNFKNGSACIALNP